jgi:hypothetical protein
MGFFSWWTKAHNRESKPIYNRFAIENLKKAGKDVSNFCLKVWMHVPAPDGTLASSHLEEAYEGYGVFGGVDYYVAVSKCNPLNSSEQMSDEQHRKRGIDLCFGKDKTMLRFPIFTETKTYHGDFNVECESCEGQGYWLEECDDLVDEHEEEEEEEEEKEAKEGLGSAEEGQDRETKKRRTEEINV